MSAYGNQPVSSILSRVESHDSSGQPVWRVSGALGILLLAGTFAFQSPLYAAEQHYPGLTFSLVDESTRAADETPVPAPEEPAASLDEGSPSPPAPPAFPGGGLADNRTLPRITDTDPGSRNPFDSDLEAMVELADQYAAQGDLDLAVQEQENLLYSVRIRYGLESEEQVPVIRSLIENHLSQRNLDAADDMHVLLMHVADSRREENPDLYQAIRTDYTAWNLSYYLNDYLYDNQPDRYNMNRALDRVVARENRDNYGFYGTPGSAFGFNAPAMPCAPPSVSFQLGSAPASSITPIRRSEDLSSDTQRLNEVEEYYQGLLEDAIAEGARETEAAVLLDLAGVQFLRESELNQYRQLYKRPKEREVICTRDAGLMTQTHYLDGSELLERRLALLQDMEAEANAIALAMLDLADWDLVFNRSVAARNQYRETYEFLLQEGATPAEADALMNPSPALRLPVFVPHQYEGTWSDGLAGESGEIRVSLTMTSDGRMRNIETVETEDEEDSENFRLRNILRIHLRDATFRPLLQDGEAVSRDELSLVYRYQY